MSEWQIIFNQGLNSYVRLINDYVASLDDSKKIQIKDSIKKLSFKIPNGLKKNEYQLKGKFPVIDQGKVSEGGFSDDESLLIRNDLPLIIFGDHTRAIKYVDYNFIIGADGVKLLKPKDNFVEKYFYYLLHGLNVGNRGYGRHFKILNSRQVIIPYSSDKNRSLKFQKNVINFLDDLEKNALKENCYFDTKIEKEILKLHHKQLETLSIFKLNTDQKTYLTKLRQQILQDAISGKLTADLRAKNPEIEPASKLLEKIKEEKEKLIAEKKIKKEKPLPKIAEDEAPFELPEKWEWCRLGEITTYGTAEKIEPKDILDDIWVLDLEDIEKESSRIINFEIYKNRKSNSTKSVFKKGDVLYSKLRPYLDKVVVAPKDGVCTTEILPLPVFGNMDSSFFMHAMKRKDFLRYADQKVKGMKMPRLGTEDGKRALFPLPPLAEQKAIVAKIEKLMEHVSILEEKTKQNKQDAEILMQSFLVEAFKN